MYGNLLQIKAYCSCHFRGARRASLVLVGVFLAMLARPVGAESIGGVVAIVVPAGDIGWVSTWTGSPSGPDTNFTFAGSAYNGNNTYSNQSIRLIVHASLGGTRVRINLSNELSTVPLRIGAAHIALSAGGASIVDGTDRTLTFNGGQDSVTIPPNAPILSDLVKLDVPALADLAVTIFLPDTVTVTTAVPLSRQTNYVAPAGSGDNTGSSTLPLDASSSITQWPILTRVDVRAAGSRTCVVLGSSIALGALSTQDANARWTDFLAKRLNNHGLPVSVVNASIVADPLLSNLGGLGALARLNRDALTQPGISYLFINDVSGVESQSAASPAVIIAGLRQLIKRVHSANVKVYAGTIIPLGGGSGYSAAFEANRQGVNDFIRNGGELDGYVDFDAAVRDPANPTAILAAYDGGDHHHPNDAGDKVLAHTFDLALFQ